MALSNAHTSTKAADVRKMLLLSDRRVTHCPTHNRNAIPDYCRNLTSSSTAHVPPLRWIWRKSVAQFLRNPANKQINTDENITSLTEVITQSNITDLCNDTVNLLSPPNQLVPYKDSHYVAHPKFQNFSRTLEIFFHTVFVTRQHISLQRNSSC